MNKLFCINKPKFISSNNYLRKIKRKYNTKKAGFSGTLDPFASGNLICAFGQYTKLFRFLEKSKKTYNATIWLGAISPSMDLENILSINSHKSLDFADIKSVFHDLYKKTLSYLPPKYSAKKINGKRAYDLARADIDFELKSLEMFIYDIKFINYSHPFINFDVCINEGGYVRSLAEIILGKLHSKGTLSSLHRIKEGDFYFNYEEKLDITKYLNIKENIYLGEKEKIINGKKLDINDLKNKEDETCFVINNEFLSVLKIEQGTVSYVLNRIKIC